MRPEIESLLHLHRDLDGKLEPGRSGFLSDWHCPNPLLDELLPTTLLPFCDRNTGRYYYFSDELSLLREICAFHEDLESPKLSPGNIIAGPGSSSLLSTFVLWMKELGFQVAHYIPPIYHSVHKICSVVNLELIPVSRLHAIQDGFTLTLPSERAALLLTDPVWYAGRSLSRQVLDEIRAWQVRTDSIVFVDGSFQYMKWQGGFGELASDLEPELTYRLVCPAKALGAPSFRFAYLIHPLNSHSDIVFLHESAAGPASAADVEFAKHSLLHLRNPSQRTRIPAYLSSVFDALTSRKLMQTTVHPNAGYFAFAKATGEFGDLMNGNYFELDGFEEYSRINLFVAGRLLA